MAINRQLKKGLEEAKLCLIDAGIAAHETKERALQLKETGQAQNRPKYTNLARRLQTVEHLLLRAHKCLEEEIRSALTRPGEEKDMDHA